MITNLATLEHENGPLAPVDKVRISYAGRNTRFHLVVVDDRDVIDTVTDHYDLVPNRALLESIERASDIVGLPNLRVRSGNLNRNNGNSFFRLAVEDGGFHAPGDPSKTITEMHVHNNYAGRGRYTIAGGAERLVCSNGMRAFVVSEELAKIHKGMEDLDEWALEAVSLFAGKADMMRTLASVAAAKDWSPARSGEALVKRAPKRYREAFADAIKSNTNDLGYNGWAAINAVTETATHAMGDTVSAKRWSDQAIEAVLADIGQSWDAIETAAN